jgi:hypothetical protein
MIVAAIALILTIVLISLGMPVGFAAGLASLAGAAWFFGDLFDPRVATMIAHRA